MSKPTRYRVANNQAQLTLGGGILAVDPVGPLVMYDDYAELRMERIHDLNQIGGLQEENARLTAELAKCEEHNEALCERMQDLNSEVFTASCTNARLHSLFANSEQDNARLKTDVNDLAEGLKLSCEVGIKIADEVTRLKAEVERLRKAGDALALEVIYFVGDYDPVGSESLRNWNAAKEGKV